MLAKKCNALEDGARKGTLARGWGTTAEDKVGRQVVGRVVG